MTIDSKLLERTIGANVRIYRHALGFSCDTLGRRLAEALGKTAGSANRQTMSLLENGQRSFRAAELLALAQVLGVTVDDLFRQVDFKEKPEPERPKTPEERLEEAKAGRPITWQDVLRSA